MFPLSEPVRHWQMVRARLFGLVLGIYLFLTLATLLLYSPRVGALMFVPVLLFAFGIALFMSGRRIRLPTEADLPSSDVQLRAALVAKIGQIVLLVLFIALVGIVAVTFYVF